MHWQTTHKTFRCISRKSLYISNMEHSHHSLRKTFLEYARFVSLLLGTGFVAGSIVHFGEGITIWDVSVLLLGILLFVFGSVWQQIVDGKMAGNISGIMRTIFATLLLSLTVGMASGGSQHFIDTPEYAALLISVGLTLGFVMFIIKNDKRLNLKRWILLVGGLCVIAAVLHLMLININAVIPSFVRVGHGSHGHGGNHGSMHEQKQPAKQDGSHAEDHPHE